MKSPMIATLVCAALLLPAFAATAADVSADRVDAKVIAAAKKKSMAANGSFHRVHKQKVKLDCEVCHETGPLPDNTLKLRLHEPLAKGSPGPVTSDACLGCHGKDQQKVVWYAE